MRNTSRICNGRLQRACAYVSVETIARTRAFSLRWYTRRDSHNREVTRVKKDVRVNLARCISGDELIPPISLWFSISTSVCPCRSSTPPLHRSLSLLLSSPSGSLSRNVPSACSLDPSLSYRYPSFWTVAMLARFSPPPTVEFLFIYGGFNEP